MARIDDVIKFYNWINRLEVVCGGFRTLNQCTAKSGWPRRGVYFFFEDGEVRNTGGKGPRIVRIGTHGLRPSKSTLWDRLREHRGNANESGGNHRGSIFRLLVGQALIQKKAEQGNPFPDQITRSWGVGSIAPDATTKLTERPLELEVSRHIGQMPFLWIGVDDPASSQSDRGVLERNVIGLLSNAGKVDLIDPPSKSWLGKYSKKKTVLESGLWNQNHVNESYDLTLIERIFDRAVN
jgi:hypothetical protein